MMQAPDSITPIRAYRAWNADDDNTLYATSMFTVWEREMTASCTNAGAFRIRLRRLSTSQLDIEPWDGQIPPHDSPSSSCDCGLYACKTTEMLRHHFNGSRPARRSMVYGAVELWGQILEFKDGYRAQHARIVELFDTVSVDIRKIAARYEVPVAPAGDMRAPCPCQSCEEHRRVIAARMTAGMSTRRPAIQTPIDWRMAATGIRWRW